MVLKNVGINSTFEEQRVVINQIAVDVESVLTGTAGISSYANSSGISSNSDKLGNQLPSYYLNYANFTGKPTNVSQFVNDSGYITGSYFTDRGGINLSPAGVVTAFAFYGSGSSLTGIVTSLVAGNNITVSSSSGQVIVSSTASGDNNYWTINGSGISTTANLGVGTTLPSTKLEVVGQSTFDGNVEFKAGAYFGDGDILHFGNSQDLQIQHNGTTNLIDSSLKDLYLNSHNVQINVNGSETAARFLSNNAVELYYDNALKFTTSGIGVTVLGTVDAQYFVGDGSQLTNLPGGGGSIVGIDTTGTSEFNQIVASGIVTASLFSGSGANLTSLPAGQLTGALPAIDGSALTGIVAAGGGVEIRDDGIVVGTASTINFGGNIDVIFSNGVATVTATSTGGSIVGIDTTGTSEFNQIVASGIVTASRFESTSAGTPTIDSPNNLNINALNVGISTDLSVGRDLTVNDGLTVSGPVDLNGTIDLNSTSTAFSDGVKVGKYITGNSGQKLTITSGSNGIYLEGSGNNVIDINTSGIDFGNSNLGSLTFHPSTWNINNNPTINLGNYGYMNVVGIVTATSIRTNSTVGDGTDVGFAIKYYITANGTAGYRFAGPGIVNTIDNPTLYLHRGFTYIFENSTTTSHPFAIRYTSSGTGYGSTYLSGSQSGTQIFTVPFDAPASLVYQCTIHGGMVGTLTIVS